MSDVRDRLLTRDSRKQAQAELVGETIGVRRLGISDGREFRKRVRALEMEDPIDAFSDLVVLALFFSAFDLDTGERLFTTDEHLAWLNAQDGAALEAAGVAALEVNGMSLEAAATQEGNSSETPTSGSS